MLYLFGLLNHISTCFVHLQIQLGAVQCSFATTPPSTSSSRLAPAFAPAFAPILLFTMSALIPQAPLARLRPGGSRSDRVGKLRLVGGRKGALVVRAEEKAAEKSAPKVWTPPQLDPSTPSPIFGGSTGGLLRKAQVRRNNTSNALIY